MPDKLRKLDHSFTKDGWPHVSCPTCGHGVLLPGQIITSSSAKSQAGEGHEAWDADWIFGVFHGVLHCNYPECKENVVVAGEFHVQFVDHEYNPDNFFQIKYISPPLPILRAPAKTPQDVREAITAASQVIWTDPSAAANRLRHAVELLMTHKRITASRRTKNGLKFKSADSRIREWKDKSVANEPAAQQLLAVKWIGNIGSHDDQLTATDVLKGAQLMEIALEYIFSTDRKELVRLGADIVKKGKNAKAKTLRAKPVRTKAAPKS